MSRPPKFIANFDSMTAMLRSLGAFLHGRDFPALGLSPLLKIPAARANLLPWALRRGLYISSGWNESIPPRKIDQVDAEALSRWVTAEYPERRYPAVAVGSSNGAGVHLCAALGIPWLPQTSLIPVRQRVHPDEPIEAMEIGQEPARTLLECNPDLQLHHMHDANQDRLMVRAMTYFRVKRRRLGAAYEEFLEDFLPPGGTLLVFECGQQWPTTRMGDRYVFQHGAVGGATVEEFHEGSERVEEYLARYGSHRRQWESPEPDGDSPEAEWGFEPALLDDLRRVARQRRYRLVRVRFDENQDLSPLVADLYLWWYRRRRIPASRLVAESFIVMEPWWTLRTGSVPFWMEFNMGDSLRAAHAYVDRSGPFDEIRIMLMNHGVEAVGLPSAQDWEGLLARARRLGEWAGGDPSEFPGDYAQFARYHTAMRRIPARYPMPGPLTLRQLDAFLDEHGDAYEVDWDHEPVKAAA